VNSNGDLIAFAPETNSISTYNMHIYCEAEGGASLTTATKTLILGCDETIVTSTLKSNIDPSATG
jgi:hypothetical protein